jgi:transglutaminase-like putative cysteine protease
VTSEAAIQLEILRRTRQDFRLTDELVLAELKKSIPDVTQKDLDRWRESGELHGRTIEGEHRYFREAVSNLFRASEEARSRRKSAPPLPKKFDLNGLIVELVRQSENSRSDEVYPVKHNVRYELSVNKGHPRLKAGARVRAWLPYPQVYRQQRDVRLVRSEPPHHTISANGGAHRTIYFEESIANPTNPPRFRVEFEFTTSAYCPNLNAAQVEPYDAGGELYREYTAERPPHIVFTPEVERLAAEIVGDETNPLEKARRIFRWGSKNIPWCSEMEYSIIPNISEKGLAARRGDCGVQGLVFITLCRAAGVPARWQSGWQTKPGDWNMHDWSEFYVEPWGWLPADASYGVREHADPRVRDFLCGHMDPYRLIVNLDYARPLEPPKTSFRSEPNDFQRGEIEIDGHNLYFDEWDYAFQVKTTPLR